MKTETAVIGIGAIMPAAMDFSEYWSNILSARDCIIDIPESYWDLSEFYDPDPLAKDKTYGYRAGLLAYAPFDTKEFGIPPRVMESIAIEQLFSLVVAKQALSDAGLIGVNAKEFNREKAGVILGSGIGKTAFSLSLRLQTKKIANIMRNSNVPEHLIDRVVSRINDGELEWNEASHPGFLPNVAAGRIGNRFDLYGTNCTVDAACAGSLSALKYAVDELENGDCDVVLTGGVMMDTTPFTFISFSKTPAIAPSNISRPFDEDADGMLLGDGVAMLVLKRLADAERDNDRIYGVLESVASSSDGRAKSIFAPRKEGQKLALGRAYTAANIDPCTVGMVEAHGTGTTVGDATEIESLTEYFEGSKERSVLVGSVKSQIGHLRLTAGVASLIKSIFAVYHNILPPTINVKKPNQQLINSPFYLTNRPKPWIVNSQRPIRRAGISAFGFGGTNFHVVLREYGKKRGEFRRVSESPVGLFFHGAGRDELLDQLKSAAERFSNDDVEYFNELVKVSNERIPAGHARIGFVAKNLTEAKEKAEAAAELLSRTKLDMWQKNNIFYRSKGIGDGEKIMSMFSGQGSQYINMLSDAAMGYPEMRDMFETVDNAMLGRESTPVSETVYPNLFPNESTAESEKKLTETRNTQPALAAVSGGLYSVLKSRGYEDELLIGHSFGEITALWAGGSLDDSSYAKLAAARGEIMASCVPAGTGMLAVMENRTKTIELTRDFKKIYVANENSPGQTIVSGSLTDIAEFDTWLQEQGVSTKKVSVSCAFHSPYMSEASDKFTQVIKETKFGKLKKDIYSNTTAKPYPKSDDKAKQMLIEQITNPVLFRTSIENAYEDGARIFIEIGPGKTLASLADQILQGKDHETLAANPVKTGNSHEQLEVLITQLKVIGMDMKSDPYFSPLVSKKFESDGRTKYMLPSLHFAMDDTIQKVDRALNTVDPLPEKPDAESSREREEIRAPEPAPVASQSTSVTERPPTFDAADDIEDYFEDDLISVLEEDEGDADMGKSKIANAMQYAYEMQSLNGDIFKQFTESQGMQIDKLWDMLKSPENPKGNMDGMLHFMELFQSNSMRAYETFFNEQSKMLGGGGGAVLGAAGLGEIAGAGVATTEKVTEIAPAEPIKKEKAIWTPEEPPTGTYTELPSAPAVADTASASASDVAVVSAVPSDAASDADAVSGAFQPGTSSDAIQERIIEVISDRTGYPVEMIDPDMDIESDLGIDSIRRVEIFSILNDELNQGFTEDDIKIMSTLHTIEEYAEFLEKKINSDDEETDDVVIDAKTISSFFENNDMADFSEEDIAAFTEGYEIGKTKATESDEPVIELKADDEAQAEVEVDASEKPEQEILRYNVVSGEIDLPGDGSPVIAGSGLVLVTWDEAGVSAELGKALKKKGYEVEYVGFPWQKKDTRLTYKMEKIGAREIEGIYRSVKNSDKAPLVGFISVASPSEVRENTNEVFDGNDTEILAATFLFAKYFSKNVSSPESGKGFFVAVARLDGHLGLGDKLIGSPVAGGLFGLIKSLHREWKSTYCRAIDISPECDKALAAKLALQELCDSDDIYTEVARDIDEKRYTNMISERLDDEMSKVLPGSDDVFLVTGGGRGVTAKSVIQFAAEYQSKFILLGRSSTSNDLSWTKGETDYNKLKPLMLNHLKDTGQVVKPAKVDGLIHEAMYQLEILDTVEQIKKAGGNAVYISCDIKNERAVGRAITKGVSEMGAITGLIHGAGAIADKNIEQKTETDFRTVFDTKVTGLKLCLKNIELENLKYIVMFSSISSYFGNEGQADYAIANEVLNKFAYDFKRRYPEALSLSINWGPWEGGMVSEGLKRILTAKGEKLISYDEGAEYFADQFLYSFEPENSQILISGTDKYISHDFDMTQISGVFKK